MAWSGPVRRRGARRSNISCSSRFDHPAARSDKQFFRLFSGKLAFALEDLLEPSVALRNLLASVGAGERREEYAETLALELELKCHLRPRAAVEGLDGDRPDRADRAVIVEGVAEKVAWSSVPPRFRPAYKKKYDWDIDSSMGPAYVVRPRVVFGIIENAGSSPGASRWRFK